jgi:hypothetical protein
MKKKASDVNTQTFFSVDNAALARLDAGEAVELVRDMLLGEARRIGLSTAQVNVSSWVNIPDGGVDASVDAPAGLQSDLIRPGSTGYQVKADTSFHPWKDSHIKRELFRTKPAKKENLGASITSCMQAKGTYILVCTRTDLTSQRRKKAVEYLKKYLGQCGYKKAKAEVWSQNNLIGMLQRFPSLSLRVNGRDAIKFQTHKRWSNQDDMRKMFKAGDEQTKFMEGMQRELRRSDEAVHLRVLGEAGIGKTRLALEATRAGDLAPLVIYCDNPLQLQDGQLINEVLKAGNSFATILVVDECDPENRADIWNRLKYSGPRIKLVSLYNDEEETAGNTVYVHCPPLGEEEIKAIIQTYGVPAERADRWAEFCTGSPRVAHVIGLNLKSNPGDVLKSPDTVNVWERYIAGPDDPGSQEVQDRQATLQYIALFKRLGYGPKVVAEAKAVAKLIQNAHPQITWARFQQIVKKLRARKIFQGENTLYITPKLLHIKLWVDWWDTYAPGLNLDELVKGLPEKLLDWFFEMFRYAAESGAALRVVEQLLGEDGVFQRSEYLRTVRGARYFLALAEASPEAALQCLRNTVGTWTKEELLEFTDGRREVIWALQRMAVWRELFADSARLLLRLAEAENETWGNNATGVFADLFSPGPGRVAPTEASLEERFPVLREAVESESKAVRLIALRACDEALESQSFSRASGPERQGLRREPALWKPQTWGEIFEGYRRVWRLLEQRLDALPDDERKQAIDIMLQRARGLARYGNLSDMVVESLTRIAQSPDGRRRVLQTVEQILHYDGKNLPREMRESWERLRDSLVGNDFPSLLERYVRLNLLEDRLERERETQAQIEALASQAVQEPSLLEPELSWLVTDAAKNGYPFAYALAGKDRTFSLLPTLLNAQKDAGANGTASFLGGYFRGLYERDQERWESLLDDLAVDEALRGWVPELTWRSGMSDRAAMRVLNLARAGLIELSHLRMFAFGSVTDKVSEGVFLQWIEFLLERGTRQTISIALELFHFYYSRKDVARTIPRELTLRLLTAAALFRKGEEDARSAQLEDYEWTELGKAFVERYPDDSVQVADKMLEHFGEDGTILEGYHSQVLQVLDEIARRSPTEVWKRATRYLGPPIDARAYRIAQWLRGGMFEDRGTGILPLVPLRDIWAWVDEDVEKRAWYLATFVPKTLSRKEGEVCLAREVLVRYGDRRDVRNNLSANFGTGSWSGPESSHYQSQKEWLLGFKKGERNENVKRWVDEYVASLNRQIERALIEEEREH